jgi:hypothetical protein
LKNSSELSLAIGKRTGAIPKRPLVVQQQDDNISLQSEVYTPVQHFRGVMEPQATSTMFPGQPVSHFDEDYDDYDEAGPEMTQLKPVEDTLKTLEKYKMYHEYVRNKEREKMRADYALGRQVRAKEDQALAAEFPDMSPRKRRTAKRLFRSPQPPVDRTSTLRQYRSALMDGLERHKMYKPQLYKHHYGKSPTKPDPLPSRQRFMSRMRDPELEQLMQKYRSTDEKQKERSERILSHISNRNVDDEEFHNTFMENVFSPPPTQSLKVRSRFVPPPLSQQAWLERGHVPDTMSQDRESVQRRMTTTKAYLEKLKQEREMRFKTVEDRRKRHYDRDPVEEVFVSDDEPDTFTEHIEIEEKGVALDGSPRQVVNLVIPEEDLLNLSTISDQSPEIVAPEAIPTSWLDAKHHPSDEGQDPLIDIPAEDGVDDILQAE